MFHRLAAFNKLGVGVRRYAGREDVFRLPDLEKVASQRGFELVRCRMKDSNPDRDAAGRDCLACIRKLASQADAIYLTALLSIDEKIDPIVDILNKNKTHHFRCPAPDS